MPLPASDPRAQRIARLVLVGALVALGLFVAWRFVPAVLWALILAIAIDPLHLRLRRMALGGHPLLLPFLITAVAALVVLIPIALGIAQAAHEAREIALWIASAKANGVPVPEWVANLPLGSAELTGWWQLHLATPAAASAELDAIRPAAWISESRMIGANLLHRAVVFGFTLLALFFVLRDRDSLIAQMKRGGDRLLGEAGERIGEQAIRSVRGTIDGLVLVGIGVGAVMALAYLALGVPHPLLLGCLTAIAAMIPFGAPIVFAVAALLLILQGWVAGAIAVVATGAVVVFVADHFIRPAMIGGATRLPFLWVLIGILGGVETMGLIGLFVGPAAMAVLVMLWREFLEGRGEAATPPPRAD